jgi:hypothetical protein
MSLDDLPLDASGFLDMDQFPDDGTVLADDALAELHDALLADPVDEPTEDDWAGLVGEVLVDDDDAPFDVGADDDPAAVAHDPVDDDAPLVDDDLDLDLYEDDDVVGLDLPGDGDDLALDAEPEAPAEVGPDFEDYL